MSVAYHDHDMHFVHCEVAVAVHNLELVDRTDCNRPVVDTVAVVVADNSDNVNVAVVVDKWVHCDKDFVVLEVQWAVVVAAAAVIVAVAAVAVH